MRLRAITLNVSADDARLPSISSSTLSHAHLEHKHGHVGHDWKLNTGFGSRPLVVGHRVGGWLPKDHALSLNSNLVDNTPALRMGFSQMFEQVPQKPPYNKDPTSSLRYIRDYDTMFKTFDYIITHAIAYEDNDLVGFPINAILDWPMGTDAGLYTFLVPAVNEKFKKMFDAWSEFLSSPASRTYLTTEENGWFGPRRASTSPTLPKPTNATRGRDPKYDDIITSACESAVYRISTDIQERDSFWLKGEPYSLRDMLNNDSYTNHPVNGVIDRIEVIPGTYYAESPVMGFDNPGGPDPAGPNWSQAYITSLAARASHERGLDLRGDRTPRSEGLQGRRIGHVPFRRIDTLFVVPQGVKVTFDSQYTEPGSEVLLNVAIATIGEGKSHH
ncbi:Phophatidylserine decarboxylase [Rhizoctonia solani]|uniref:Phophatidylserine decarboxylase n=1 Tax=Rhizoctonia solani TaxID=456999 RepID=A0A8H7M359_9AGAM|nr:Phophatidylserine decarboxylase [Rhizoctonia solani]